jgi:hypothetical protein
MRFMFMGYGPIGENDAYHQGFAHRRVQRHVQALNRVATAQGIDGASGLTMDFGLVPIDIRGKTLTTRASKHLVVDGPFAESKEAIGGFDLIDLASRDAAVAYAKEAFEAGTMEIRPAVDVWWAQFSGPAADTKRFVLLQGRHPHASESTPSEGAEIFRQHAAVSREYIRQRQERGAAFVWGGARLRPSPEAFTVRIRADNYLIADGPFTETKELIGGLVVLDCASFDEAAEWARKYSPRDGDLVEIREVAGGLFFYHG